VVVQQRGAVDGRVVCDERGDEGVVVDLIPHHETFRTTIQLYSLHTVLLKVLRRCSS
jgi:hypothetical protein